jgi:hypothetical protein
MPRTSYSRSALRVSPLRVATSPMKKSKAKRAGQSQPPAARKELGENPGRDDRPHPIGVGEPGAEGVNVLRLRFDDRERRADEERPATPQNDGRGQHELSPGQEPRGHQRAQRLARHHVAHDEEEQRDGQHGAVRNCRAMSTSSGSVPSSTATVRRSRAIPHFEHEPGPAWRISGCIGQVYSIGPLDIEGGWCWVGTWPWAVGAWPWWWPDR